MWLSADNLQLMGIVTLTGHALMGDHRTQYAADMVSVHRSKLPWSQANMQGRQGKPRMLPFPHTLFNKPFNGNKQGFQNRARGNSIGKYPLSGQIDCHSQSHNVDELETLLIPSCRK